VYDLKDQAVIVTGAGGFLGQTITEALSFYGAQVIGVDVKGAQHTLDISNSEDVAAFYQSLELLNGPGCVYGLVNNAAVSFKGRNTTPEQFQKTLEVNVAGTNNMIEGLVSTGLPQTPASIVNLGSIYGMLSPDFRIYDGNEEQYNSIAYGASKAAVIQLTKYYAVHLASKGIRVNTVSPSGIQGNQAPEFLDKYSQRVPEARMVTPQEVANVIAFLLSRASSGINGTNIPVTAGMDIW
jgi:NAD(P)-dependent dehydrogenase (short-subunit alcohol dehydrogenase family)